MIKTVIQYVDSNTFGGCEEVVLQLLAGFDRNRWRNVLFHHDEPGIARLRNEATQLGITCRTVPRITGSSIATTLRQFIRELRAEDAAIFHAHLNWPLGCRYGLLAAWLGRVPGIVATSHLYSSISGVRFSRVKHRIQAATISRYVTVSHEVKKRLCQDLGIKRSKLRVVHNGIRLSPFERSADLALRNKLTEGSGLLIVFTPARLHSQKGHVYLLQAAALVPDALFVLAGDGPDRGGLEAQAQKLGIEDRVRFLGQRQDIPQLLASCDLFVLPSLFEGLPLSVLEAMAAGKPVIATDIGGTNEAVVHGVTGLLVPPENPTELASAIRKLLADRGLADRLAAAGKLRVQQMFSSEAMVRGVTRVYDELV